LRPPSPSIPKQAPAYLGLAEVYIAQNDFGKAAEILQQGIDATGDESLQKRLEEINSGNISDYWGNQRKRSGYDAGGALQWYHVMDYKDGREIRCTSYDAAGTQIGQVEVLYDEQGNGFRIMHTTATENCSRIKTHTTPREDVPKAFPIRPTAP
jgi:hypothetical protein